MKDDIEPVGLDFNAILELLAGDKPELKSQLKKLKQDARAHHNVLVERLDSGRLDPRTFTAEMNRATGRLLLDIAALVPRERVETVFNVDLSEVERDASVPLVDPDIMEKQWLLVNYPALKGGACN